MSCFDTARVTSIVSLMIIQNHQVLENFITFIYSYIDEENFEAVRDQARLLIDRFVPPDSVQSLSCMLNCIITRNKR